MQIEQEMARNTQEALIFKQIHKTQRLNRQDNKFLNQKNIIISSISTQIFQKMHSSESFTRNIKKSQIQALKILKKSTFNVLIDERAYEMVICLLCENCIIFKTYNGDTEVNIKVSFDFSVKFQMIRNGTNQKFMDREPYAIKLEREKIFIMISSYHNPNQILQWRNILKKYLNQRGFHDQFKPLKKIGRGIFASVFSVLKLQDNKRYAAKSFSKQSLYANQKGRDSLIKELEIMKKLNNKNIVKIYQVYQSQNSIYIILEVLEGGQLSELIQKKHRFTFLQIRTIMKGILQGLETMHKQNIMHRDLRFQNLMMRKQNDFDCVVTNFRLAEFTTVSQYLYRRCGTPGYVAPEIVNLKDSSSRYTQACDLFSLGVIFHMLIFGQYLFAGTLNEQILDNNRKCIIDFQQQMYQQISESWLDLLKCLLEVNPSLRITASQALQHKFFKQERVNFLIRRSSKFKLQGTQMQKYCCLPPLINVKTNQPLRKNSFSTYQAKKSQLKVDQSTDSELNGSYLQRPKSKNISQISRFRSISHNN